MASRWSPLRSLSEQAEMRCRAGWAVSSASRPWLIRPQARSETARETGGARSGGSGKGGTCRRRVQRKGVGGSDILGGVGLVSSVLGSKARSRQAWSCGLVAHQDEGWSVEHYLLS